MYKCGGFKNKINGAGAVYIKIYMSRDRKVILGNT